MQLFGVDIPTANSAATAALNRLLALGKQSSKSSKPAWRGSLRQASFRGVAFFVSKDEQSGGRRVVPHEFVGRDQPFTEDMGRKARTFTVEGYVIGDNYMPARDALLNALEAEGPGVLVTPWMPERRVVCSGYSKAETKEQGGLAAFSLTFTERGEASLPDGTPLKNVTASDKADAAITAAGAALDKKLVLSGIPVAVQESTLAAIKTLTSVVSTVASVAKTAADIVSVAKNIKGLAVATLASVLPSKLLSSLWSLNSTYKALSAAFASTSSSSSNTLAERTSGLITVANAAPKVTTATSAGTVRSVTASNLQALSDYQRAAATAEAARSAALVQPASKADATALREQISDAIDAVLETTTDDATYVAFLKLRTATMAALAEAAGSAPDVVTVTTKAVLPVLLLAQRHMVGMGYATNAPDAADDLLARNPVRHPGFVAPGDLEVLRA